MKTKKKHIIVFCPLSLNDPLIKGLILDYVIQILKEEKKYVVHFFTDEQEAYQLNTKEKKKTRNALKDVNLIWYPIKYRNGGSLLLFWKVLIGVLRLFQLIKIKLLYKPKLILGYVSMAGGYAYLFSKILGIKLGIFCFEPHSEYMIDFGIWTKKSLRYKILKRLETLQVKRARYITAPTKHTSEFINAIGTKAKIFPLAISVDFNALNFSAHERKRIRNEEGIGSKNVLLYLGKFNGVYYSEKRVASFLKKYVDNIPESFILIITPDDVDEVRKAFLEEGLDSSLFKVKGKIPYEQLSGYISSADVGLISVPPLPAQKFRTPVKTANYLACGIPVITNFGVSDEAEWLEKRNIGVGLNDFELNDSAFEKINLLLKEDKASLRERCRQEAIILRSKANSVKVLKEIFEEL